ncbi:MAG: virulence protein [Anaerovoracaceae bacterium]|jgi:hypothetical protein
MRINYNVTGARRKELVKVISDTTGVKADYKFMPTCNFEIGNLTVTKNGTLEWDDRTAPEIISRITEALTEAGFTQEPDETAEPEIEKEPADTEESTTASEETGLTVEIPSDKVAVGNLTNILEAKGSLIKKALGVDDLRFEIKDDRIAFPWFKELPEPDEAKAYTEFISLLCKLSKELKRTSSKETPVTNEKYAFRCFLLRLGFIGSEYKGSRKILLRNLSGNSSWKNGAPEKESDEEVQA